MYLELKPTYNNRNSVEWKNRMRKKHIKTRNMNLFIRIHTTKWRGNSNLKQKKNKNTKITAATSINSTYI